MALLLGFTLAACGSDPEPRDGSPTRAGFIEQVNRICNENNDFLRQATAETFAPDRKPDDETGIRFTREIWVPNMRQQSEDLRALEWPEEDRQKLESIFAENDRAIDRVEADPGIASEGPFDRVTRRMTEYGIGPCGSP